MNVFVGMHATLTQPPPIIVGSRQAGPFCSSAWRLAALAASNDNGIV
jgi:hypothetical protein